MKISTAGVIRGIINPIIATIHQEINGEYSCFVSIPISDNLAEYFEIDAIVYLTDSNGSEQQFRLQKPERTLNELNAFGWHISQDLANDIILNSYWANKTGAQVFPELLQAGIAERRFTGTADIGTVNSMRVVRKSVLEAILGDDGFVARFGGEINRDNFDIDMLVQQGENRNYRIIYKKNLTGLQITNDSSTVVNRIIPTYLNENNAAVLLPEIYIDSALISNTAIPHAKTIHYGDIKVGEEVDSVILYPTTADAQAEVRARVAALYAAGVDLPLLTVEIGFIQLRNTLEYADYSALEIVQLGDTIGAVYGDYSWTSRVVSYDWDALLQKYNNIILGTVRPSASDMSASISANAIAAAQESLRQRTIELTGAIASAQTTADGKNTVYYSATEPTGGVYTENDIWFDTDNDNKTYLHDGSVWVPVQFGENAIADLSITNAKIKDATIQNAKIANLDAAKITTGTLNAARVQIGSTSTFAAGYDPSTKETPSGAQSKADSAYNSAVSYANTELASFESAILNNIDELQDQIDGNITTWFYDYEPTLLNIPASEWTSTELKNRHLGDLFYDSVTGYAYRFQLSGQNYQWVRLSDSDITAAMQAAQHAEDLADSKRRVFISQPVTPYDVGDLWSQGTTGDLMRCKVSRASGSYQSSDWEKASKYTDDTAANAAQATANQAKQDAIDKANAAQTAAQAYADTKAEAERVLAEAYADGIVTAEEQARINDVNAKLATAQTYAETKASEAETAAKAYAEIKAGEAQSAAISYTDTQFSVLGGQIQSKVSTTTYEAGIATKENNIIKQSTAPTHLNGRLWLDTSLTPNVLKRSTGSAWVKVTPTTASEVGAYSSADGSALAGRVTTAETSITQNAESIELKVNQTDLTTVVQTLEDNITSSVDNATSDLQEEIDTKTATTETTLRTEFNTAITAEIGSVNIAFEEVNTKITNTGEEVEEMKSYFDFNPDNLRIGKSTSPLAITISNEQMDFIDSGVVVAYINGQQMNINALEVMNRLLVGVHQIEKYDSDTTLVKWVGGS